MDALMTRWTSLEIVLPLQQQDYLLDHQTAVVAWGAAASPPLPHL